MPRTPAQQLDLLRRTRVRGEAAQPLGPMAEAAGRELMRLQKKLGGVGAAWAEACPPAFRDRTWVEGVSRGILSIRIPDASTRYEVDRWLREGGEREVVRRCPTTVRKVKLVIG